MAEDFLEKIYKTSELISVMRTCCDYLDNKNMPEFAELWSNYSDRLVSVIKEWNETDESKANLLNDYSFAVGGRLKDIAYARDIIDSKIIPLIYEFISMSGSIDVTEGKWQLSSTKSGFLNLYDCEQGIHLHSLDDPFSEAKKIANNIYDGSIGEVLIMGAGLGYLPYAIWEMSEKSVDFYIFEPDAKVAEYAISYGLLGDIPGDHVKVFSSDNPDELLIEMYQMQKEKPDALMYISYWAEKIFSPEVAKYVKQINALSMSIDGFERYYKVNFRANKKKMEKSVKEVKLADGKTDYIVVAAGPSLDEKIEYLRENKGKKVIIAVNTVLKRLLKENIKPDYVCVVDPTEGICAHVEGVEAETEDITLIAERTTYWKYVDMYRGPIYCVYTSTYGKTVEEAEEKGEDLWAIGFTVTGLAVEAAVRFGARTVELIGADFAYPNNKNHAGDNEEVRINEFQGCIYDLDVHGKKVKTVDTFVSFREGVVDQIKKYEGIRFINLSEGGAHIRGTVDGEWKECFGRLYSKYVEKLTDGELEMFNIIAAGICDIVVNGINGIASEGIKLNDIRSKIFIEALTEVKTIMDSQGNAYVKAFVDSLLYSTTGEQTVLDDLMSCVVSEIKDYKEKYCYYASIKQSLELDPEVLDPIKLSITDSVTEAFPAGYFAQEQTSEMTNLAYIVVTTLSETRGEKKEGFEETCRKLVKAGITPVVLNTGERDALIYHAPVANSKRNDQDIIVGTNITVDNAEITVFDCGERMPNIDVFKILLDNIKSKRPVKIYSLGDDSCLAWLIERFREIEYI